MYEVIAEKYMGVQKLHYKGEMIPEAEVRQENKKACLEGQKGAKNKRGLVLKDVKASLRAVSTAQAAAKKKAAK